MAKNFDHEQLAQLASGDKAFEKELLQMFIGDTENSLNELATAIAEADAPTVHEVAHYIKGVSANVGAVALSNAAAQLEQLAKKGNLKSAASSLKQMKAFHQEVKRMAR